MKILNTILLFILLIITIYSTIEVKNWDFPKIIGNVLVFATNFLVLYKGIKYFLLKLNSEISKKDLIGNTFRMLFIIVFNLILGEIFSLKPHNFILASIILLPAFRIFNQTTFLQKFNVF